MYPAVYTINNNTHCESLNRCRNPATARGGVEGCRCGVGENSPDISKFYVPKKGENASRGKNAEGGVNK